MRRFFFVLSILFWLQPTYSSTIEPGSLIRDAEIEEILHSYIDPILGAAHINPRDLTLYVLVSNDVNAFATFNTTICIYTGFLLKTERVEEVIGVLAHEIGHLAGKHLVGLVSALENAQKSSMLGTIAGVALAVLAGRPDLAVFSGLGSQNIAQYSLANFSQGQETIADQLAIKFLKKLCWPTDGLGTFLKKLSNQELLSDSQRDPYLRTHPLTTDRIQAVQRLSHLSVCTKKSPHPALLAKKYTLLKTKLEAFLLAPVLVLRKYTDKTFLSQYAQSIAYYRLANTKKALEVLENLVLEQPQNPFLWELKGQILYESGQISKAIQAYTESLILRPNDALLLLGLAQALISAEKKEFLEQSLKLLKKARRLEPKNILVHHYLSIAYGRQGKMGLMSLSLAEKAFLEKKWAEAKEQIKRALYYLKAKAQAKYKLRAEDLKNQIDQESERNPKGNEASLTS